MTPVTYYGSRRHGVWHLVIVEGEGAVTHLLSATADGLRRLVAAYEARRGGAS